MLSLDGRRRVFVREYMIDLDGARAAVAAGLAKKANAATVSKNLLQEPLVALAIEDILRQRERALLRDADRILNELAVVGFSDARKLFRDDGSLKPPNEWPDEIAGAVASVEVDELFEGSGRDRVQVGFTKKVKFWNKNEALSLLGKNLKLFGDVVTIRLETMTDEERALRAEALIRAGLTRAREQNRAEIELNPPSKTLPPHG